MQHALNQAASQGSTHRPPQNSSKTHSNLTSEARKAFKKRVRKHDNDYDNEDDDDDEDEDQIIDEDDDDMMMMGADDDDDDDE